MILGVVGGGSSLIKPAVFDGLIFEANTFLLGQVTGFSYVMFTLKPDGTWEATGWNHTGTSSFVIASGQWLKNTNGSDYEARALISGDPADENDLSSYTAINGFKTISYQVEMQAGIQAEKTGTVTMTIRKISKPDYLIQADFTLIARVGQML